MDGKPSGVYSAARLGPAAEQVMVNTGREKRTSGRGKITFLEDADRYSRLIEQARSL